MSGLSDYKLGFCAHSNFNLGLVKAIYMTLWQRSVFLLRYLQINITDQFEIHKTTDNYLYVIILEQLVQLSMFQELGIELLPLSESYCMYGLTLWRYHTICHEVIPKFVKY